MSIPWLGPKRVAVIPVINSQVDSQPQADWMDLINSRVFFSPDPQTGFDVSLQHYIRTISHGEAFITGGTFSLAVTDDADTIGAGLRSLPPNHGFDHALIVLPHSVGSDRGGWAVWDFEPVNGISRAARVAMFGNTTLTKLQPLGVWAMELLHITTEFGDLYNVTPELGRYDIMACSCGTHPTVHTKRAMGWIAADYVITHNSPTLGYQLHAHALPPPPPRRRVYAVQIPSRSSRNHFLVEARLKLDPYEQASQVSSGIPTEGVIIYEVASELEVYLRTPVPLQPGERYSNEDAGFDVDVTDTIAGGFAITVRKLEHPECRSIFQQIVRLESELREESDPDERRRIRQEISELRDQGNELGCQLPRFNLKREVINY